jgi:hypothetical protein
MPAFEYDIATQMKEDQGIEHKAESSSHKHLARKYEPAERKQMIGVLQTGSPA